MERFFVSLVIWIAFLALSTVIVYVGVNYGTDAYKLTWGNAFAIAFIARVLFSLNKYYAALEEEYHI